MLKEKLISTNSFKNKTNSISQSRKNNTKQTNQIKAASQHLTKNLEAKSIMRTSVETYNLTANFNKYNALSAACLRTFSSITFPASQLLLRKKIETNTKKINHNWHSHYRHFIQQTLVSASAFQFNI